MGRESDSRAERWRCFLAIDLTAEIVERLNETICELRRVEADVRWARDDGLHLTLAFLGSVEVERLPAIQAAVEAVAARFPPIDIEVRGLGAFPNRRRANVLWAGVSTESGSRGDGLQQLASAVAAALAPLGFVPDERPFRAHVTIGRVRSRRGWRRLEALIAAAEDREFGRCKARGVAAYRSDLRPDGAVYTKLWTAEMMGDRDGNGN